MHVERSEAITKFWLNPVKLQRSKGFARDEIHKIQKLVEENEKLLLRSWNEFFKD